MQRSARNAGVSPQRALAGSANAQGPPAVMYLLLISAMLSIRPSDTKKKMTKDQMTVNGPPCTNAKMIWPASGGAAKRQQA